MFRPLKLLFLIIFINSYSYASSEYGWVQDVVGIDENAFNYVEGSDPDLELYVKNLFFDSLELSPDGQKIAFLSESNDFTQGILVVDVDEYFGNNRSFEKSTIAKAAMENKPDTDLGVRAMFICDFLWANNQIILVQVCGKRIDFIQGEVFFSLGIWKTFNVETKEFKNFIYPLAPAPKKGSITFQERYKIATFISKFDDDHVLMSVPEYKRGFRYAHLRKINLNKRTTEPKGQDIYVSNVPCQYKEKSRVENYCNNPNIFLIDKDKKPLLTLSNDLDGVYLHRADTKSTKINVDLEKYGIIGIEGDMVYLTGDPSGETNGISLLNLKTNKINAINPVECHSFLGGHYSLGDTAPYAVEMECDGVKDSIPLEPKSRDAQILAALRNSFPNKELSLGNWTDKNDKAIMLVEDSSSIREAFLIDLSSGKIVPKYIATASNVPRDKLHKNEPKVFKTFDGNTIYGYLTKPKKEIKKLAVYIHGGPYGPRDYDSFDPYEQYLASKGVAVLKVNYRGSGGYGINYQEDVYQDWGGKLIDDIAAATMSVQKELGISSKDTCATGASYGGYASMTLSYKYPELYECAAAMMGVYDIQHWRYGRDENVYTFRADFDEAMEEILGSDNEKLDSHSPALNASDIKTRVLMWHGLQDQVVPISHQDKMKEALEKENIKYQAFTMSRLGHTYGREDDMKAFFPVLKDFILSEL